MGAPRKLPPANEVIDMVIKDGKTYAEIADEWNVSHAAVAWTLRNAGIRNPRGTRPYKDVIPWKGIAVTHNNDVLLRRLRLLARRNGGVELSPAQDALLEQWLAYMRENDAVVTYDRDRDPGFRLAKRQPGEVGLVRP